MIKRQHAFRKKIPLRVKEILVVTPASGLAPPAKTSWMRLFEGLSHEWRVFWIQAPRRGQSVAIGRPGLDPVSIDTLPAIKRVLAEQHISAVFLVGNSAMDSCLEYLNSFAPNIPYMVVLDKPWPAGNGSPTPFSRLEFTLGLADRLLVTNAMHRKRLEPFLRRLPLALDVVPRPEDTTNFRRFKKKLSNDILYSFRSLQTSIAEKTPPALMGLLPRGSATTLAKYLQHWRRSLRGIKERTFLASSDASPAERRSLERQWPRSRWIFYRDDQHRVELLNRTLRACRTEFALIVTETARLQPLCLGRMLACGKKLPLVGGVSYNRPAAPPPLDWKQWQHFGNAWAMRFEGAYRIVPHLHDDCFLLKCSALDAIGALDTRLGWRLTVRDYSLRLRQAGFNLFIAEDAVAASVEKNRNGIDAAFENFFVSKWNLDPLALTAK